MSEFADLSEQFSFERDNKFNRLICSAKGRTELLTSLIIFWTQFLFFSICEHAFIHTAHGKLTVYFFWPIMEINAEIVSWFLSTNFVWTGKFLYLYIEPNCQLSTDRDAHHSIHYRYINVFIPIPICDRYKLIFIIICAHSCSLFSEDQTTQAQ